MTIRHGDVRALPFDDGSFDGYWSLGVIEHFQQGYLDILAEARRVLRPGGILFLAAPSMSPLRRLKAKLNLYPRLEAPPDDEAFYQFALHPAAVISDCRKIGFALVNHHAYDPMTTLAQEAGPLGELFRWMQSSRSLAARLAERTCVSALTRVAGHSCLFVLRRP
ncbi:MAG: class I SAM-dependent methyltransferase [Planctomycetota bacterium]